jgi:hypothetical protein
MSRNATYKKLIEENSNKKIVEIGVWSGDLSFFALRSCKNITDYFMVDPLTEDVNCFDYEQSNFDFPGMMRGNKYICNMGGKTKTQYELNSMYSNIMNSLEDYPNAKFIRKTSKEASVEFEDESLDMVFIDAIHLYENVLEDINLWLPKVKKGGILSGDDFTDPFPGVKKAVNEYFQGKQLVENGIWYITKK